MDRSPDQETGRRELSSGADRDRVSPQVHAVGSRGQRDVDPIVDDNPGRRAPRDCEQLADERRQRSSFEIVLADLDEIECASILPAAA
jgi:hypothetical protein